MKNVTRSVRYALSAMSILYSISIIGEMRRDGSVTLPYDDAAKMAEMLERMLRAPRFDAPQPGDPDFQLISTEDEELMRRIVCLIRAQFDECCSLIDHVDCGVGDKADSSIDLTECVTLSQIDATQASLISWVKTIVRDLRGLLSPCNQFTLNTVTESNKDTATTEIETLETGNIV